MGGYDMKIAVVGAGSLGTIMGALIAKNGLDVVLVDANNEHVDALNKNGATVTGTMEVNVPVTAITPDRMEGTYDLVLYLVKQTANEAALTSLLPHLHEKSIVCTLQNGVPEDAVAMHVGRERVVGCAVGWGATWLRPGVSQLTSSPDKMTFDLGELEGPPTERIKKVADVLESICPVIVTDNLAGIRWTKLLINATFSGMSAVLGCTYGDILDDRKALTCVTHIANEIITVVDAIGVTMEPMQGADLRMLAFGTKAEMESKFPIYEAVFRPHALLKASMLQDIEKGLKTEIDAINGVVCQTGSKVGVATLIDDKVVEIIKGIEGGKYKPVFDNLALFTLPEVPEA
jgi:2-dehydropantoate 2-reductase